MKNYTVNKTWKFKVLTVLAIVMTLSLGVYMYQGNNIILQVEGEITEVVSYSNTVEDFLQKENVSFKEGGYINIPLDTKLEDNMHIIIKNLKPYTISLGGMVSDVASLHNTVGEVLNDLNIELKQKDFVVPDPNTKIGPGSKIEVFRVVEVLESTETVIPFESTVNENNKLDKGVTNVVQEGQEGLKRTDYKKKYINGNLISTTMENEEIVLEPISHIVEKGTKEKVITPRENAAKKGIKISTTRGSTAYKKAITMNASAYDASFASTGKRPGDKYYGITASGTKVRPGVVAVDPRVIPLGTKLYVESTDGTKDYGFAIAEDKGGAIKGNKIDLYFETATEVKNFGRRNVKVYILP